jgi:hypothetical protein
MMTLKGTVLSGSSQLEKITCCMFLSTCCSPNNKAVAMKTSSVGYGGWGGEGWTQHEGVLLSDVTLLHLDLL